MRVALVVFLLIAMCGGTKTVTCPPTRPASGESCASFPKQTKCTYDASLAECGSVICGDDGKWYWNTFDPNGCPAPDGGVPAKDPKNPFTTCTAFGTEFGPFDKTCSGDPDCAFGKHTMSCCGDVANIGFNKSQTAAFNSAEATCSRGFPGCGCASSTVLVEVGNDAGFLSTIVVSCINNACMTHVQ